ncbi:MAG: NAD(P)H-hydrate dehydratase [Clostridia bacterium]|nr:NAD(P)H-hydrate dehydratase [Clostridia bacterium]
MLILTPEEIRQAEAAANAAGLSYETMMVNAGNGCAKAILAACPGLRRFVLLCGKGKNGGDGFVIAARLREAGKDVVVVRVFDAPSDALSETVYARLPQDVKRLCYEKEPAACMEALSAADAVVDAIFGIGFKGTLPAAAAELIAAANALSAKRFAVDIPSGLSVSSPPADCFQAHRTLSMLCFKEEHIRKPWKYACGRVSVIPIGFEATGSGRVSFTAREIAAMLPERPFDANKGTFGNTLVLGGSRAMPGAALIAADGALHAGAGLVTLGIPDVCLSAATAQLRECVFLPLASDGNGQLSETNKETLSGLLPRFSAVVFGNGAGTGNGPRALLKTLLKDVRRPLLLDADGINLAAGHIDELKTAKAPVLLTPHPGEMARLTGTDIRSVLSAPEQTASAFAKETGAYVLLKGANSVIAAPDGRLCLNAAGGTALSRGGSGDLLAGIAGAFLSQGAAPFEALVSAAFVHGLAGEKAERRCTAYAATVEETVRSLGAAFKSITESKC